MGADQLNQIKEDVDMVALIEDSYDLDQFKRTGPNRATAICPFHDDHNPSLSIDGDRGLYRCFSCGAAGDVFNFVRQYHKETQKEEMPFMEGVRRVHAYHDGGSIEGDSSSLTPSLRVDSDEQKVQMEKRERIYAMNQEAAAFYANCLTLPFAGGGRYYLQSRGFKSPAAAKAFALGYAPDIYFNNRYLPKEQKSLVRHLEERGFKASEILASGLASQTKRTPQQQAKSGSRNGSHQPLTSDNNTSTSSNHTDFEQVDITTLIDRFRGRLLVPIFDRTGQKVAGFGGRILPIYNDEADHQNNSFKPPKYLNSPETAVFQKRSMLFGQHMAIEEYKRQSTKRKDSSKTQVQGAKSDLLMVEGYMDVLALWDCGVKTAVATMGTAISLEQVNVAARIAAANGGRVVLCLDNDEAGYSAVERLCLGGFLRKACSSFAVQFCIATLSSDMKDPGEFIEHHQENGTSLKKIAGKFLTEVVEPAQDWPDWFLKRILDRYDESASRGMAGSFGDVFQRVTDFLSTFPNPADRTKSAFEVAGLLAKLLARENNSTSISKAAQMQLESDLIDSASRIASEKEVQKRRNELPAPEIHSSVAALPSGEASADQTVESNKLSRKAFEKLTGFTGPRQDPKASNRNESSTKNRKLQVPGEGEKRSRRRMYKPLTEKEPPSLTPHFAGFHFENPTDAEWLGIPRNKAKAGNSILTLGDLYSYDGLERASKKHRTKPVYFNSNDYHGQTFISSDAVAAGYSDTIQVSDYSSIMDKGVASLVQEHVDGSLVAAEDALLNSLISQYPESRNAVKDVMQASACVGPDVKIEWSSPEREWLFSRLLEENLMDKCDEIGCDPASLLAVLAERDDVPHGAFSELGARPKETIDGLIPDNERLAPEAASSRPGGGLMSEQIAGTLDPFFAEDFSLSETSNLNNTSQDAFAQREKAALAAQELLMSLLSTSASHQIQLIQNDIKSVSSFLHGQASRTLTLESSQPALNASDVSILVATSSDSIPDLSETKANGVRAPPAASGEAALERDNPPSDPRALRFQNTTREDVEQYYKTLLRRFQIAIQQRNQLDRSTKRITERLVRFSGSSKSETVEGRISVPLQKRLARDLDEHLDVLEEMKPTSDVDNDDRLGKRDVTDATVEDEVTEIENSWGDWCEDDFIWSPEKASRNGGSAVPLTIDIDDMDNEEESESLDESLERIDDDWKNWID